MNTYRPLSPDEILRPGDEYQYGKDWYPTRWSGVRAKTTSGFCYRRPVPPFPGEGFRLLSPEELIHRGDQWFSHRQGAWFEVDEFEGRVVKYAKVPVRRRVELDPGPGWRLLEKGELIQVGDEIRSSSTGMWRLTALEGERVEDADFRRRVSIPDPGWGWRLLEKGELIQPGDEIHITECAGWSLTALVGERVDCAHFRRRITPDVFFSKEPTECSGDRQTAEELKRSVDLSDVPSDRLRAELTRREAAYDEALVDYDERKRQLNTAIMDAFALPRVGAPMGRWSWFVPDTRPIREWEALRETDEFVIDPATMQTHAVRRLPGDALVDASKHRVTGFEPLEYRFLMTGETLRQTDEFACAHGGWGCWTDCGNFLKGPVPYPPHTGRYTFRRRLKHS